MTLIQHVRCQICQRRGVVPSAWAGVVIRCRECGWLFQAQGGIPANEPRTLANEGGRDMRAEKSAALHRKGF